MNEASVSVRASGDHVHIDLSGDVDLANASEVEAKVLAAITNRATTIALDLSQVTYLDSAGLAAIFPHVDNVRLLATPLLVPVLTVAGLDDLTTVHE